MCSHGSRACQSLCLPYLQTLNSAFLSSLGLKHQTTSQISTSDFAAFIHCTHTMPGHAKTTYKTSNSRSSLRRPLPLLAPLPSRLDDQSSRAPVWDAGFRASPVRVFESPVWRGRVRTWRLPTCRRYGVNSLALGRAGHFGDTRHQKCVVL